jgi:hypothetical protein
MSVWLILPALLRCCLLSINSPDCTPPCRSLCYSVLQAAMLSGWQYCHYSNWKETSWAEMKEYSCYLCFLISQCCQREFWGVNDALIASGVDAWLWSVDGMILQHSHTRTCLVTPCFFQIANTHARTHTHPWPLWCESGVWPPESLYAPVVTWIKIVCNFHLSALLRSGWQWRVLAQFWSWCVSVPLAAFQQTPVALPIRLISSPHKPFRSPVLISPVNEYRHPLPALVLWPVASSVLTYWLP